jgi:hypothetical protein
LTGTDLLSAEEEKSKVLGSRHCVGGAEDSKIEELFG